MRFDNFSKLVKSVVPCKKKENFMQFIKPLSKVGVAHLILLNKT